METYNRVQSPVVFKFIMRKLCVIFVVINCVFAQDLNENVNISAQKCREYSTFVPEYQIFAISGGVQTGPSEFPHMAALGYTNGNGVVWQCGGSLVSENYILTAGHCLNHLTYGQVTHVRIGSTMLPSLRQSNPTSSPQDISVASIIPHPNYRSPSTYNDIALLRLARSAQFSNFVKPACLYNSPSIPNNEQLVATGWGLTNQGGNQSATLQKVDLDLFSEKECNETYRSMVGSRRLRDGINSKALSTRSDLLARYWFAQKRGNAVQCPHGPRGRDSHKDTCQGDSGGPRQIYSQAERIWSIVGVTSFGKVCGASIPGVYTKVSHYVPWLESVIWTKS